MLNQINSLRLLESKVLSPARALAWSAFHHSLAVPAVFMDAQVFIKCLRLAIKMV